MASMMLSSIFTALAVFFLLESSLSFARIELVGSGTVSYRKGRLTPSLCYGNDDKGHLVAQVREDHYERGSVCGQRVNIVCWSVNNQCEGIKSVAVTITGKCIETKHNKCDQDFVLSEYAYSHLVDPNKYKVVNATYSKIL